MRGGPTRSNRSVLQPLQGRLTTVWVLSRRMTLFDNVCVWGGVDIRFVAGNGPREGEGGRVSMMVSFRRPSWKVGVEGETKRKTEE